MHTIEELYRKMPEGDVEGVTVSGWVRSVRDSKSFGFMEINDGTSFLNLQAVLIEENMPNYKEVIKTAEGSAVTVSGTLVITPNAKQPFELRAGEFTLVGASDGQYPLQKKRHSLEYLRTIAHLRPRTNTFMAVFRIRSLAAFAIHKYFNERGFVYVHTPIITGSDCEGAGEMFRITTLDLANVPKTDAGSTDFSKDFFGREASLTVSGQLNVESFAQAFRNVYTFGPTFRAEVSYTPRHAAEFWMIEPEIAFADIWEDMAVAEGLVKYVIEYVLENAPNEMEFLNKHIDNTLIERLTALKDAEFGRVSYADAMDILKNCGEKFEYPVGWGNDLQTEHERYLTEKHFGGPVFVYDWPKEIKSFYMRQNDDGTTVAAADMLVPVVGELVGGSQREERMDRLEARIDELGLSREDYWWYLELRRWGSVPHSGFGVGFERLIMYLTGVQNIRDVTPFPRTTRSAEF